MRRLVLLPLLAALGCSSAPSIDLATGHFEKVDHGLGGPSLRGLSARGEAVWASGSGGKVWRRDPETGTWSDASPADMSDRDFRDVVGLDSQTALAMAIQGPSAIYRTDDAGATWSEVHRCDDEAAFFDTIAIHDDGLGMAFGDPVGGVIYVAITEDHGRTWQRLDSPPLPTTEEGEAGFAASGTCVALPSADSIRIATGGKKSRVLGSDDRGASWWTAEHPLDRGGQTTGAYSISFADEDHGVLVGGDYTKPDVSDYAAAWTDDGGRTWNDPTGSPPAGYRSGATRVSDMGPLAFVATGPTGTDLSLDGGRSWQPLNEAPGANAARSADGSGTVWLAGSTGGVWSWKPGAAPEEPIILLDDVTNGVSDTTAPDPELLALVEELREELGLPALAVAIHEQKAPDFLTVAGDTGRDLEPLATRFRIASISKTFTATALSLLAADGTVALDDPITKHLPEGTELAEGQEAITLRQLADHSSGLPRLPKEIPGTPVDPYGPSKPSFLYDALAKNPLESEPGKRSAYSNLGAALLGQLLARANGTTYEELITQRILEPLGMSSSDAFDPDERGRDPDEDVAVGHNGVRPAEEVPYWHMAAFAPTGGVCCTIGDLHRYAQEHLRAAREETTVLDGDALRSAHTLSIETAPGRSVGLAWQRIDFGEGRIRLWHNGGLYGFRSLLILDPFLDRSVTLLTNQGFAPGADPLETVAARVMKALQDRR